MYAAVLSLSQCMLMFYARILSETLLCCASMNDSCIIYRKHLKLTSLRETENISLAGKTASLPMYTKPTSCCLTSSQIILSAFSFLSTCRFHLFASLISFHPFSSFALSLLAYLRFLRLPGFYIR